MGFNLSKIKSQAVLRRKLSIKTKRKELENTRGLKNSLSSLPLRNQKTVLMMIKLTDNQKNIGVQIMKAQPEQNLRYKCTFFLEINTYLRDLLMIQTYLRL